MEAIQEELNRRKPGQSAIVTQRKEPDEVHFYSGVFEGKTTGTPIGFAIYNTNQKSKDYSHIKDSYRPSHADYVYEKNMVYAIIAGAEEALPVKPPVEWLPVLLQSKCFLELLSPLM